MFYVLLEKLNSMNSEPFKLAYGDVKLENILIKNVRADLSTVDSMRANLRFGDVGGLGVYTPKCFTVYSYREVRPFYNDRLSMGPLIVYVTYICFRARRLFQADGEQVAIGKKTDCDWR